MKANISEIELFRQRQIDAINRECGLYGDFQTQYDKLESFRNKVYEKYIDSIADDGTYKLKNNFMINAFGIHIDHHIISYLAPLSFERIGWGGRRLSPLQQINELSDFLAEYGTRLIYVALPNKGHLYLDWLDVGNIASEINCPQWRKYLKEVLDAKIECLDFLSIFKDEGETDKCYFRKEDHNLSGCGSLFVARKLAEYIKRTTDNNIGVNLKCKRVTREVRFDRFGYRHCYGRIYPILQVNNFEEDEIDLPYLCDDENSPIAVFGDCNLQAYETHGAGIAANLAMELGITIDNVGRKLVFSNRESMTKEALEVLKTKDIAIYVAFCSAPFVRTSEYNIEFSNKSFCTLPLL